MSAAPSLKCRRERCLNEADFLRARLENYLEWLRKEANRSIENLTSGLAERNEAVKAAKTDVSWGAMMNDEIQEYFDVGRAELKSAVDQLTHCSGGRDREPTKLRLVKFELRNLQRQGIEDADPNLLTNLSRLLNEVDDELTSANTSADRIVTRYVNFEPDERLPLRRRVERLLVQLNGDDTEQGSVPGGTTASRQDGLCSASPSDLKRQSQSVDGDRETHVEPRQKLVAAKHEAPRRRRRCALTDGGGSSPAVFTSISKSKPGKSTIAREFEELLSLGAASAPSTSGTNDCDSVDLDERPAETVDTLEMQIFCSGFPDHWENEHLRNFFAGFSVQKVFIRSGKSDYNGRRRKFAFINLSSRDEVIQAVEDKNGNCLVDSDQMSAVRIRVFPQSAMLRRILRIPAK